jgi:hypothetical protein
LIPHQNQKKLPKYGKIFLIKKGNIKAIESISDANFAFESRKIKTIRMN